MPARCLLLGRAVRSHSRSQPHCRCSRLAPPAGLWLFSRKPADPEATAAMRAEAARLGFDLSVLKPVAQAGCSYPAVQPPSSGNGGMQLGPKKLFLGR